MELVMIGAFAIGLIAGVFLGAIIYGILDGTFLD